MLVSAVQECGAQGQAGPLSLHLLSSGLLGPLWEEVRHEGVPFRTMSPPFFTPRAAQTLWRGFFLASLTKVLPLPTCIAISCVLYLRSGSLGEVRRLESYQESLRRGH